MNVTMNKVDLIVIETAWHPITEEYTLFSSALGAFTKMSHMLGHKSNPNKYKD